MLAIVQEDAARARGREPDTAQIEAMRAMVTQKFEEEASPYYATARLWDDGILDPLETRDALGLALAAALHAPVPRTTWGVFRM